ncbi:hypothetical protein D3C73_1122020 [compost metagenome]
MHEEERQDHADHADVEDAGDVHGHPGRGQARRCRHDPFVMHQAQAPTGEGNGDDADEDRTEHFVIAEDGDHQEAYGREQWARFAQGAELDQGGRAINDDARSFQTDQTEEQTDAGAHGEAQADRDAVEQPFANPREGQNHEQHTGDKHRTKRGFPVVAHGADHGISEERVQTHARRQADRPVRVQAHQQAAQCSGDTGGDERRAVIDPGVSHDVRVDENDVGHRDEGSQTGNQLGLHRGAMQAEFKQALQQAIA